MPPDSQRSLVGHSTGTPTRLIDDPVWVLARYHEAKELLDEVWADPAVPLDLRGEAENFHHATLMDTCTTMGADCACNGPHAQVQKDGPEVDHG